MEQPSFFAYLPAAVRYDKRLKAAEKIFYAEITALADKTSYCYASNAYFMRVYGVSERTVQEWIKSLTKCGYITVEILAKSGDSRCERRISPIFGLDTLKTTPAENCTTPAEICGGTPADFCVSPPQKSAGRIIQDNNNTSNNTTRARGFDRFWAAYPRKVGKGAAEKSFERIRPDAALVSRMLAAIAAQKNSDNWQRGYIPNPATWLNQRRWEDEIGMVVCTEPSFAHYQPKDTSDRPREIKPGDDITQYL